MNQQENSRHHAAVPLPSTQSSNSPAGTPRPGALRAGVDAKALLLAGLLLAAVAAPIWPTAPAGSPGAVTQAAGDHAPDDAMPWPGGARPGWETGAGSPASVAPQNASGTADKPALKKPSPPVAKPAAAVAVPKPAVAAVPQPAAPAPVAARPKAAPPAAAPVAPPKAAAPAPAPKVAAPVVAPAPPPVPAPAPAPAPAPPPAPAVRTIYVAGAGGQALVDSCIGPIHFTPTDGYSLFITEHDFCGGWARFSGIQVGERVDLPGYGSYTVAGRGQVPNGGTTNDVAAVFGGFPRAVLQTCIPGTTQMLVIALN
jgi:hypothetical protein